MRSCWYLVTDWVCILETRVLGFGNAVEKNGFIRKLPRNNQICKKGRKTLFNLPKTHFSADFGYTRTVTIYGGCYIFFVNSIDEKYINQKLGPGDVYVRIVYSYQGFHLHLKFFHHKKDVLHSELNVQKNLFWICFLFWIVDGYSIPSS